ncbi:MAG: hypothetical protein P8M11_09240 [Planctomycetota bacterium]|nr:hypothetical protein [Planctomycetota bacterium]
MPPRPEDAPQGDLPRGGLASGRAPATSAMGHREALPWRALAAPLLVAAAVRAALAIAFSATEPLGDERAYLLLAERWRTEGAYEGIWAPGYPALIAALGGLLGDSTVSALRGLQVLLGVWIVACTGTLSMAIGGRRCGVLAAWIAALYLPLAGFSGLLYSELLHLALFLPALVLLSRWPGVSRRGSLSHVAAAGLLLGLAALVRESSALFIPILGAWVALQGSRAGAPRALPALTLLGCAAAVILPWTLRNATFHGRLVPIAISTGGSAHIGLNAYDVNYDLAGLGEDPTQAPGALRATIRGAAPEAWTPTAEGTPADRARRNVRQGVRFAVEHPLFFLRSRAVELVDLLSPLSYPVRSLRLASPGPPLGRPWARLLFAGLALAMVPTLLLLALRGWSQAAASPAHSSLLVWVCAGTLASALVNGLTRYRLPALPLLIAFAALGLVRTLARTSTAQGSEEERARRTRAAAAASACLVLLWIPSLEGVQQTLSALR